MGTLQRSTQPASLLSGAEPFQADGGPVGVLVIHGFTGTPQSVRGWAEHLAAAGHTVRLPLLPGHGTSWKNLNRTGWPDWFATVEQTFDELRQRCSTVFACGLSMGGTLALRLAEQHPDDVAGLVVVNPALGTERWDAKLLPVLRHVVASRPGIGSDIKKPGVAELAYDRLPLHAAYSLSQLWRLVCADLGRIRCPVLLLRSREDHVVEPLSARLLRKGASSCEVTEQLLDDSYHVATLDNDAERIFADTVEFIASHTDAQHPAERR